MCAYTTYLAVRCACESTRNSAQHRNFALDRLISGLQSNPRKLWFMAQIQPALQQVATEDTEAREQFGMHVEKIMDIVGIDASDGMLSF